MWVQSVLELRRRAGGDHNRQDPGVSNPKLSTLNECVCDVMPFILDVRLVDVPAGVTQEEGRTRFLIHLPFCGACLHFSREKDSAIPFPHRP